MARDIDAGNGQTERARLELRLLASSNEESPKGPVFHLVVPGLIAVPALLVSATLVNEYLAGIPDTEPVFNDWAVARSITYAQPTPLLIGALALGAVAAARIAQIGHSLWRFLAASDTNAASGGRAGNVGRASRVIRSAVPWGVISAALFLGWAISSAMPDKKPVGVTIGIITGSDRIASTGAIDVAVECVEPCEFDSVKLVGEKTSALLNTHVPMSEDTQLSDGASGNNLQRVGLQLTQEQRRWLREVWWSIIPELEFLIFDGEGNTTEDRNETRPQLPVFPSSAYR